MDIDESLLTFPCSFPIKAMGKDEEDFDVLVIGLIRRHSPDLREGAIKSRRSKGGRFVSVTVTIEAESREQLDNIYMDLCAEERILMAL